MGVLASVRRRIVRAASPRRPADVTTCELARESLSAEADGESATLTADARQRHVDGCASCRAFADDVNALNRTLRVRAADAPGEGASAVLALLGVPASPPGEPCDRAPRTARRAGRRVRHAVAAGALWAVALIPLGVAVPALAAGAFAHVHIVGTHAPSPCTLRPAHPSRD